MLNTEVLKKIKGAEIEVEVYDPTSRNLPTVQDVNQRRESLLQVGLITPIIITKDEDNKPLIVDGNLRYKIIRELKQQGKWNEDIDVLEVDLAQAKNYRDIQTNHKNYSKIQLAIYADYHYRDKVEKASLARQQSGTTATNIKGKTSEIVGKMGGVGKTYVESAHKLLDLDREFFYNLFVIQRHSIKKAELNELLNISSSQSETYNKIIDEIKRICEENKNQLAYTEKLSIYNQAYVAVVCPNDMSDYKNIDINEIIKINTDESSDTQDKSAEKEKRQAQHDKNAKEILQADKESKEPLRIGISFQKELPEEMIEGIEEIMKYLLSHKIQPILIKDAEDLKNFQNANETE